MDPRRFRRWLAAPLAAILALTAANVTVQVASATPASAVDLLEYCDDHPGAWWGYRYEACAETDIYMEVFSTQTRQKVGSVTFHVTRRIWTTDGAVRLGETITVSRKSYTQLGGLVSHDVDLSCTGNCVLDSADAVGLTPPGITSSGTWYVRSTVASNAYSNLYTNMMLHVSAPDTIPGLAVKYSPYIRCDKLSYLPGEGCVFPWATPTAYWDYSDPFPEIVQHIADAQARGLPGKPGTSPLHRLNNTFTKAANRAIACPDSFPRGPGQSCDEYPFASTREGAASGIGYSARAVTDLQNSTHGGSLSAFLGRERIADGDAYWVAVPPSGGGMVLASYSIDGGGGGGGGGSDPGDSCQAVGDYTGDCATDLALYRQDCATGSNWWVKSSATGNQLYGGAKYGGCADIPAPGDYDGDGHTDRALYRQDCTNGSGWWVSSTNTGNQLYGGHKYGGCTDIPAPGDYDGDGYTDLALYRRDCVNGSSWWIQSSRTGEQLHGGTKYGGCTDIPAPGDYDGDGRTDLALYRQDCATGSSWWVTSSATGNQLYGGAKYGGCADIPAPGDYDADGHTDRALYRKDCTNGSSWWVTSSRTGTQLYGGHKYGGCADIPAPGDYDGDEYFDLALYRRDCAAGSAWWVQSTRTGSQLYGGHKYGGCTDIPTTGS